METVYIDLDVQLIEADVNPTTISPLMDEPEIDMTKDIVSMNLAMAQQVADEEEYESLLNSGNIEPNYFYFSTED